MNEKMRKELEWITLDGKNLPPELLDLLAVGFIEVEGCFFLQSLKKLSLSVSAADFSDKTGFECFVNSIHIDDYVVSEYLSYAFLFVDACFDLWRSFNSGGQLFALISSDEFGVVVKLHLLREGESWLSDDLEKYEDALLCTNSSLPDLQKKGDRF